MTVARNAERLEANAARIRQATGRKVEVVVSDLSEMSEIAALAARFEDEAPITLLVNNAGMSLDGGALKSNDETLDKLIVLNITAPTLLSVAATRAFMRRKVGAVVNISSVTAFAPEMFDGVYSGSKNYLLNLTISLAGKAREAGVRVQAVLPGPTNTDMWRRSGVPASVVPREVIMEPEDLVEAALTGLERGEIITAPTINDEAVWRAYEDARRGLGPHLARGKPADRYI
jgi:short-subunit dehydrogenase